MSGYRLTPIPPDDAVTFEFAGRELTGRRGEPLAAALLASGARIVARSFKYHRPRGIVGYGRHEPNAHVGTARGNALATILRVDDGLRAWPLNCWPSAAFDLAGIVDRFGALLQAGFYYKTFMGPGGRLWPFFEPLIQRMAGIGKLPTDATPMRVEKRYGHCETLIVGGGPAGQAAAREAARSGGRVWLIDDGELPDIPGVTVLRDTLVIARHEGGLFVAVERDPNTRTEARLWKIRAANAVLATGAVERPMIFRDNDRPGVMMLSAVLRYARDHGVAAGKSVVVFANNDGAHRDASELASLGVNIRAVVDLREGEAVVAALGCPVRGCRIAKLDGSGTRDIDCDTIAMAGGWTPLVHLHSHAGGKLRYAPDLAAFLPDGPHDGATSRFDLPTDGLLARWEAPVTGGKAFVDFAADVTAADVRLAAREGYDGVELLKRYTTLGMAPDQGRLSNMNALDILAREKGVTPDLVGTTTFRPPYAPTEFALLAEPTGKLLKPSRTTTLTAWHEKAGAVMYESGANWRRPGYYPKNGENLDAACARECFAVRNACGVYDSSPLGKFEVIGADAAAFLDFVYATRLSDLAPGRGRYALQLHEDGRLFDDGIVFRLSPERYFVTTTTGNADASLQRFEYCRQILRPDLRVHIVPVTEQWADIVVCGPQAREALAKAGIAAPRDLGFMGVAEIGLFGRRCLIARAGFTGELSFEVFVPNSAAPVLWERMIAAGAVPVGSEANHVLRIEKGFISVGHEGDGIAGPDDLGLGFAVHAAKPDFIGKASLLRDRADTHPRPQLVGLMARDPDFVLPEGATILRDGDTRGRGYVTASCRSVAVGRSLAMGLLENGRALMGQNIQIALPGGWTGATVVKPAFYDQSGGRQRG
jgi:sarcosine oxidase, subunit alpha